MEEDGNAVISMNGEVDCASAGILRQTVRESLEWTRDAIVFGMREATYLKSEGIKAVLEAERVLRDRGGRTLIQRCGHTVKWVFEVLGLERYCRSYPARVLTETTVVDVYIDQERYQ